MKKKKMIQTIFFLMLSFCLSASLFAQTNPAVQKQLQNRITLNMENVPLNDALHKIAEKGGFQLLFSETFIPTNRIVSVNFNDVPAAEALQKVLAQTSTDFKVTGAGQIVLVPSEANPAAQQSSAKNGIIAGNVYNSQTDEPLTGANVYLENTSLGAATDEDGMFIINNVPPGNYTVAVNFIGFKKYTSNITLEAGDKAKLNFALQPSLMDLDAIVVTGSQGGREKRALASPVTVVSENDLKLMPIENTNDLFEGKVPGGYNLDIGFASRNRQTIALRGSQAFTTYNNTVKTYIDGVEVADYGFSPLASLDYNDIEKIEILRGPMASTLYGSGASGGVIQIFTKRGSRKGTRIRFKSYATATSTPYLDKTPVGQNYSLNLSSGAPGKDFTIGVSRSKSDLPYPNNGIKDEKWRFNGGANITSGPFIINMKASFGSSVYGSVNNPYKIKLAEERGWTDAPDSWNNISDRQYTNSDQLASMSIRHIILPNWYQNLTLGYNKSTIENNSLSSDLVWVFDPSSGWIQVDKFYYLNRNWTKRTLKWFTNTKQTFGEDFTADITAGLEHTLQSVEYLSSNLDVEPETVSALSLDNGIVTNYDETNTGYFAETVFGYKNQLFLTAGMRLEDNSYYGDEYGLDNNPRLGLSYVYEYGNILAKPRFAWGKSTKAPKVLQKDYRETAWAIFLANPELGPESQSGYEVGADLYYGDIFSFEMTYYDQLVKNGITTVNVDDTTTTKREYQYQNINEFFNKGWEFAGKLLLNPFTVNFTYTINNSKYGDNQSSSNWRYKEGAKKLYTPDNTASLGLSYKIPALIPGSKKGGFVGMDLTYTGKMLVDNILRQYDGYYNPNIDRLSSDDPENLKEKEGYYKLRLRGNYWFTDYLSVFVDIINLTDYQKSGYNEITPSLGRVTKIGLDIQL